MTVLPESLYTPDQVRALDRAAIDEQGIPGAVLMSRAGRAAWALIRSQYPEAQRLLVLCGGGNNGGDGYVIARLAAEACMQVDLCPLVDPARLTGDAAAAAKGALEVCTPAVFEAELAGSADVVVDALLGTGLDRPVEGELAGVIHAINASASPIVAIDVPSGLSARTGQVLGVAARAEFTPTFIGLKQGLFTGDAADYVGQVVFDDLQVPQAVYQDSNPSALLLGPHALTSMLPPRPKTAHKGCFGHVLVMGGDHGMGGAVRIAAEASVRAGAGLTSVATRSVHIAPVIAARPEVMAHGIDSMDSPESLTALIARASVLAVGPGLGTADWGRGLLAAAIASDQPLVVDADALNILAQSSTHRDDWILTPHPGEAARLLATDTVSIAADRFAAVQAIAKQYGGVAVLKGAGTLISDGKRCAVCIDGNPGMASGGMGDALTGVIAGLRAQGLSAFDAACCGVLAHAQAADWAAETHGERGLLAGDLIARLPVVLNP